MKKNVLKAMSVGLSAVTIASTLSVPVYADEPAPETTKEPEPISGTAEAGVKDSESEKVKKPSAEEKIAEHSEKFFEHMNNDFNEWDRGEDGGVSQIVENIGEAEVDKPVYDHDENPDLVDHAYNAYTNNDNGTGASPAASSSEDLKDYTNELNQADKKIDRALSEAGNAVGIGEKAVTDAETIVAGAQTAVEEAVVAVRDDSIPNAEIKVNEAKATLDEAEKDFETQKGLVENARLAFEAALTAKETAEKEYNTALTKSKEMAETAKKELEKSQEELWKAKSALDKATYEFSQSAAAALLRAEFDKNVWHNNAAYVQAIIENYIVQDGETVKVSKMDNGDAKFEAVFTKEDGSTYTVQYGYSVDRKTGEVDVFTTEKVYTYGDKTLTESEYKALEDEGKAVKRYWVSYIEPGRGLKFEYLTSKELQLKKHYWGFKVNKEEVIIMDDKNTKEINNTFNDQTYTKTNKNENITYEGFDAWGNYIRVIKNDLEKKDTVEVNGKPISSDKYLNPETKSLDNAKVLEEAIASIKEKIEAQRAYYEENGFDYSYNRYFQDFYGQEFEITDVELTEDAKAKLDNQKYQNKIVDIVWTVDGRYVPIYYKINNGHNQKEFYADEKSKNINIIQGKGKDKREISIEEAKQLFLDMKDYKDTIITGVIVHKNQYEIVYVRTYDIKEIKEDTAKKALEAVARQAVEDAKGHTSRIEGAYTDVVNDVKASKITIDSSYKFSNVTAEYLVSYTKKATQEITTKTIAQTVKETFRKLENVFNSKDADYLAKVAEAQAKQAAIANLNKELWDANIAVGAARCEVAAIENELKKLKEKSPLDHVAEITELELNLQNAETELGKKEERLTEAKNRWTQANADLLARIAAQNQNQGGGEEERSYTYNPNVIPTIASIPAVTLPDAGVPLAAATRRVRRVAGVEEVEATEETVEETTPEETTEVTVTETEENPVVIDDEDVARAGGTQRSFFARTWWAWLLLVIAAIGGAVAYTKKKATDLK